ncbi:Transmembrane 7 superfamily member 3 [Holothuria leucospilota]|uniref:Transmembrane 7 superfamily member 3 n=1 Tax=Holothuria leucospilota TaxID=206669 RepID=A0A9Q0YPZ5_HOLLE|nr:Transmembrane 7 superfamily member 3 [Holothuria leucospilota]
MFILQYVSFPLQNFVEILIPPNLAFECSIPEGVSLQMKAYFYENTSAVMIQFHTLMDKLTLWSSDSNVENATGYHGGILQYATMSQSGAPWYLASSVNHTVNAIIMVTFFTQNDPVPGACNQEFTPENEPRIHFNATPSSDLAVVEFANANVGEGKGQFPPACDDATAKTSYLQYDVFIYYMPAKDYYVETMNNALLKMMTPESIKKNGLKIKSLKGFEPKAVFMALFKNRGIVYNVVVYDTLQNISSAYIPFVNYACDSKVNTTVCTYMDMGPTLVYTFSGLVGVILCFLGHWTFMYEMFMFGFLPTVVGFYMIFAANTAMLSYAIMTASVTLGLFGGAVLTSFWWRFGKVTPVVLWISLVLGFHVASVLFFTPFGYLNVWQSTASFGLAFASVILIVPIFGLLFPKWISIIASSVVGSYMMIATLSFFIGGIMQYIIQNIVHRASADHFDNAVYVLPGSPLDYILGALWCILAAGGVACQKFLTRKEPNFPECPYHSFIEKRKAIRLGYQESPQNVLVSGTVNLLDSDQSPLVGDL